MAPPTITIPTGGPPVMSKQSTPKTMSSRLMTMKFMQRGVAASASTPEAATPTTPRTDEEGSSAKRRKVAHMSAPSTPSTPTALYDRKALEAAKEEEERKYKEAIEKRALELGDSHWVLDGVSASHKETRPSLNVVQVGFAQIDSPGVPDESEFSSYGVNMATKPPPFRQFNMSKAKANDVTEKAKDDSDSSEDSGDEHSEGESSAGPQDASARGRRNTATDTPLKRARSNVSFSDKRNEERQRAQQMARERRKKDVRLNQLTSISSAGSQSFQQRPSPTTMTCHGCGKVGHRIAECPKRTH
ncbi:hypothetical protein B0T17DRAFT_289973 [Bombardia bombarda]|uniref:CCHC-type domain-containing protein n=1 Tax=Bombardia bombarda TaxID=252184 RepID=A0AA40C117_9PEZI|nr:hypothetical protein B0T17DRAFT_289973 [Bombardia bombarda]